MGSRIKIDRLLVVPCFLLSMFLISPFTFAQSKPSDPICETYETIREELRIAFIRSWEGSLDLLGALQYLIDNLTISIEGMDRTINEMQENDKMSEAQRQLLIGVYLKLEFLLEFRVRLYEFKTAIENEESLEAQSLYTEIMNLLRKYDRICD